MHLGIAYLEAGVVIALLERAGSEILYYFADVFYFWHSNIR